MRVPGWVLALLLIGTLAASPAAAQPDPGSSTVPDVIPLSTTTGGISEVTYTVVVNSLSGPIDGSLVQITFTPAANGAICWCVGQTHPTINTTTNVSGEAVFTIRGGGCLDGVALGDGFVATVTADGVQLGQPRYTASADVVNLAGAQIPDGKAHLGDAMYHTDPIVFAVLDECTDFNADGTIGLADAVLLYPYIQNLTSCTCQ